jgi:NodT family efflux transporter outer membrane factor (OMF) lipoprotein
VLPSATPAAWQNAGSSALPAPDLQRWWTALNDPALDALVEQALKQNLVLAQARSRLRQARLLSGRDAMQFRPMLNGSVKPVQDAAAVDSYLHAGFDASWELGLFGLRQAVDETAAARVERAVAESQAARVTLVAEVVRQHLLLRQALQQQAALRSALALAERQQALLDERQRLQLGSLDAQRALVLRRAQLQAQDASQRHAATAAAQALAGLLGQTAPEPGWLQAQAQPPAALPPGVSAVPADLLRCRPDIRAAESEVARAAGELGMARAELAPRILLGASYVRSYNVTQNRRTVLSSVPAIGPVIDIPLLDWGRRKANADARDEALSAALLAYRQALVDAVGEVETALSALAAAQDAASQLGQARQLAGAQEQRQGTLARLGLAAGLERLEAERTVLQAAQDEAAARWSAAQAFVTLYKALGGAPWDEAFAPTRTGAAGAEGAAAAAAVAAAAADGVPR